ncbi:MAG: hypothetical protein EOO74_09960, partial [Myxococcales bacterium]
MQSNNPVFARSEQFNGRGTTTYPGAVGHDAYGAQGPSYGVETPTSGPMTIDSVVQKTGMTLLLLM